MLHFFTLSVFQEETVFTQGHSRRDDAEDLKLDWKKDTVHKTKKCISMRSHLKYFSFEYKLHNKDKHSHVYTWLKQHTHETKTTKYGSLIKVLCLPLLPSACVCVLVGSPHRCTGNLFHIHSPPRCSGGVLGKLISTAHF